MTEETSFPKARLSGLLTLIFLGLSFAWLAAGGMTAEPFQWDWVRTYDGPGHCQDMARALAVDRQGYVYVSGTSMRTDYADSYDFFTLMASPAGAPEWSNRYGPYGGRYMDQVHDLGVDSWGNVYVAGMSKGPGGLNDYNYTLIKIGPGGNLLWDRRYGSGLDYASAMALAVDSSGNVYATGYTDKGGLTMKFDPAGTPLWPVKEDPAIRPAFLALDPFGNVCVAGTAGGENVIDFFISKYDPGGNQLWEARYDGPEKLDDRARAMAVDRLGNVYVTGDSVVVDAYPPHYVYTTVKYDSGGGFQWKARYFGVDRVNIPQALGVDPQGNVYVTGYSSYNNDSGDDFATVKYDAAGNQQWVDRFHQGIYSKARALAVDRKGYVYVTGGAWNAGAADGAYTIKYSPTGERLWVAHCPGLGFTTGNAIKVDGPGNVYVAGEVWVESPSGISYPDYLVFKLKQPGYASSPLEILLLD